MNSEQLTPEQKAVIRWAEAVTNNTARYDDEAFNELKKYFTDAQIVEITLISAMFNMFNRFMEALQVEVEPQDQVDLIKRSVRVDPQKFQDYLRWVAGIPK